MSSDARISGQDFTLFDEGPISVIRRQEIEPEDFGQTPAMVTSPYFIKGRTKIDGQELVALASMGSKLELDQIHELLGAALNPKFIGKVVLLGPDSEKKYHFLLPPEADNS